MDQIFEKKLAEIGLSLNSDQYDKFNRYYKLLVEWNKVMNLTGITEYNEVVEKHFIDSLSIVKAIDMKKVHKLIDVGTGAGFPGIPLKIAFPHLNVTLLDSLNKRILFLDKVTDELDLGQVSSIHGRAEEYAHLEKYREYYDMAVSRAVANLSSLSEYCLPFVRVGGIFVSYKSGDIEEEMENAKKAITILGGKEKDVIRFTLPETDIRRSLVVIKKKNRTGKKFPRKVGLPTKDPIH